MKLLNDLIQVSLTRRWVVLLLAIGFMVWGLFTLQKMPLDVFPNFAPPQVTIQTEATGLAPEEIEALVTVPLESALNGTPGLTDIRSSSAIGLSVITVVFEWNTDAYRARQLVTERIQQATARLPQGVGTPILLPLTSPVGDVIKYALTIDPKVKISQPTTLMALTTLTNWQIRNRLLAIPGVTRILILGGEVKQYQVLVKPEKLKQYGVTLAEVTQATEQANRNAPGGFLQSPDQELLIRGVGRVQSLTDLEQSVITERQGTPVRIKDVATVALGAALKRGDGSLNGQAALILTVSRQPTADTPTVIRAVEAAMTDIKATLPKDVKVTTTFRQEDFIEKSVTNVVDALRDGAIIVAVILVFFLGNWRTMVITLVALPLSVLVSILILNSLGVGLNTMTLGGLAIALGEVIDDAIIDAENVYRRLRENSLLAYPLAPLEVIYHASVQIRSSVVFATLILCVVVVPIFFLTGVEGQIFKPLGLAFITSILASLLVALTVTPAMCYLLLVGSPLPEAETWTVQKLKELYRPVLNFATRNPWLILGGSLGVLLASLTLVPGLGKTFLPEFQERNLIIAVSQFPGASLSSTQQIGLAIETALKKHPEIESAQFRAGRALGDDDAGGVNFGELDVQIAASAQDRKQVLAIIRDEFAQIPGVAANVGGFISHRIDEVLSGSRSAIAIKVFGADLNTLRALAQQVAVAMKTIPGVVDLQVEPQVPIGQIDIKFDRAAAARYGLTIGQLSDTVETAFKGRVVSQVLENQQVFDLLVWLEPAARQQLPTIANLLIDTPAGQKIPLSQVASITQTTGPNTINRQNVSRRLVIAANASGRDIGSLIAEARTKISARVQLPTGYFIAYGGQFEAQERATSELLIFSGLALLVVILLIYSAVRSVRSTLLILANLPLALIGGIVAVFFGGGILSVASLMGFITLIGVANRNGIILVTTYNHLLAEGMKFDEVLVEGSLERLSPVLMTALTAGLSMIPLIIGAGAGKEILQPLAVVVLGGLFTSTALTLVVIPALFTLFGVRTAATKIVVTERLSPVQE